MFENAHADKTKQNIVSKDANKLLKRKVIVIALESKASKYNGLECF